MLAAFLALPLVLLFQDPQPAASQKGATAEAVFKSLEKDIKALPRPTSADEAKAIRDQTTGLIKTAVETNQDLLATGDGVHWRARIEALSDRARAKASFEAHAADPKADKRLANASLAEAFILIARNKEQREAALKLLASVDRKALDERLTKSVAEEDMRMKAPEVQEALVGKAMPRVPASHVLNAPKGFDVNQAQGKVLVVDFWATWCGPCQKIIPDLVALQEKHKNDGLQVIGLTRIYTYGSDFTAESQLPSGKHVDNLDLAAEIKVNENFVKAFKVNYPIVVTDIETAIGTFGVYGIPTVFVVGRDGKILGSAVGAADAAHKKVEELIAKALGKETAAAVASATKENGGK